MEPVHLLLAASEVNAIGRPDFNKVWSILRWLCVIPSYLLTLVTVFITIWMGLGSLVPKLADTGASWFSIVIVLFASAAAISVSALIAPNYKLSIAILLALVTVWLVPYPYTSQSSGDGEAIPSGHEIIGVGLGSLLAIGLVFFLSKRAKGD